MAGQMTSWLHEQRLEAALAVVIGEGAGSVLDLGCGDGDLFLRLARHPQITRLVGIDIDPAALERLRGRLKAEAIDMRSIDLHLASMTRHDPRLEGFDCALMIETIEHVDPGQLSQLENAVFGNMRPGCVVVTTPNAEFNAFLGVPAHRFRHPGHRFEWSREKFRRWAGGVAGRSGYTVLCHDIAGCHPTLGGASQMAVFRAARAEGRIPAPGSARQPFAP